MVILVIVLVLSFFVLEFGTCLLVIPVYVKLVLMCVSPFTVVIESRSSGFKRSINVPCGKCIECVKRRQNDWKLRITKECESWSHVYFFTLTYRDSMLPCNLCYEDVYDEVLFHGRKPMCELQQKISYPGSSIYSTVDFDDVRRWLKRFRTNYEREHGSKWNVKYFICSEYGPNPRGTKRPHYHGIFMTDLEYNDLLPMFNEWSEVYGRIQFDECGISREEKSSVANYVSKYCSKGCFESRSEDINAKRIKRAYSCMSKSIGLKWIEEHSNDWLKYVPSYVGVDGDWDIDLIEDYFNTMKSHDPEDYSKYMLELDNLIMNLKIYDGNNFAYKLPRFYYNYLFGRRLNDEKPQTVTKNGNPVQSLRIARFLPSMGLCESSLLSLYEEARIGLFSGTSYALACFSEPITYESKMAKNSRYVSSTFLSASIAYRLRMQFIAKYQSDFDQLINQGCSDSEAMCILQAREDSSRKSSERLSKSSLQNFYESNMWRNRALDFDADSFDNQLFTNF